jgi:hypothetical protein
MKIPLPEGISPAPRGSGNAPCGARNVPYGGGSARRGFVPLFIDKVYKYCINILYPLTGDSSKIGEGSKFAENVRSARLGIPVCAFILSHERLTHERRQYLLKYDA